VAGEDEKRGRSRSELQDGGKRDISGPPLRAEQVAGAKEKYRIWEIQSNIY
jgi:hypothetical protein